MEQEGNQQKPKVKSTFKKVAEWSGLLRNFGSIITSLISLFTLFILIRQNERTYRPDLAFSPSPEVFSVRYQDDLTACKSIRFESGADSLLDQLTLRISNLGMGAAKDLLIAWSYDPDRFDDTTTVGHQKIVTGLGYNRDLNALLYRDCFLKESREDRVEFCLPINSEKEPVQVAMPRNYVYLWFNLFLNSCGNLDFAKGQRIEMLKTMVTDFQDLKIKISYLDIDNKFYQKQYVVQFVPRFIDLSNKQVVVSVNLKDTDARNQPLRHFDISMHEPDHTFFETVIDL